MDLFPKSNKDLFRRRIFVKNRESEMLEAPSTKWQLQQWESATRRANNNETALETEMEQTMDQINHYLNRLEVATVMHKSGRSVDWSKNQELNHFLEDQVMLGHSVMGKMKEFLDLEDTGVRLSRSFRTLSNRSSATGVDTFTQGSEDNVSQCSRFSSEIKGVMRKFNHVINMNRLALPHHIRDPQIAEEPLKSSGQDSLQFLTEYLTANKVQATFKSYPFKPSESCYRVTCSVFNKTVEGKAPEKMAAKKAAAVKMLEKLIADNLQKCLPPNIKPFKECQLKEAVGILCETEKYDETLANMCEERRRRPPHYYVQNHTRCVRVYCSALGLEAAGTHKNPIVARRVAAREVLLQFRQKHIY